MSWDYKICEPKGLEEMYMLLMKSKNYFSTPDIMLWLNLIKSKEQTAISAFSVCIFTLLNIERRIFVLLWITTIQDEIQVSSSSYVAFPHM